MRIVVVGSGAREHALAWKLSDEAEVICAPGNPGIAQDCECVGVGVMDFGGIEELCRKRDVDLVVVGPEDPLIAGLADMLRGQRVAVYGPFAEGAQLEGSKKFSKEVMHEAGVPTAAFRSFTDPETAKQYARERFADGRPVVIKASGAALGKGVIVCDSAEEAEDAIDRMIISRELGAAGETVVIEERLSGREFSLLTIVGNQNFVTLPIAQDYKRVGEGDQGPNTGGMGSYSPVDWLDAGMREEVEQRVVAPVLAELERRGIHFRGTLFSGLMLDGGTPYCLEYNVRFGDPETESIMLRLGGGFAKALLQAAKGEWLEGPEVRENAVVSVVVASRGYPGSYHKGLPISLGGTPTGAKLFHAGTSLMDGRLVTSGGRVICASAEGTNLADARRIAYEAAASIQFDGAFFRRDIAA